MDVVARALRDVFGIEGDFVRHANWGRAGALRRRPGGPPNGRDGMVVPSSAGGGREDVLRLGNGGPRCGDGGWDLGFGSGGGGKEDRVRSAGVAMSMVVRGGVGGERREWGMVTWT